MLHNLDNKPLYEDHSTRKLCEATMLNMGYIIDEVMTFDSVCQIPYQLP